MFPRGQGENGFWEKTHFFKAQLKIGVGILAFRREIASVEEDAGFYALGK
jgi:hypothetical protein